LTGIAKNLLVSAAGYRLSGGMLPPGVLPGLKIDILSLLGLSDKPQKAVSP
jgi:hypothetical protein